MRSEEIPHCNCSHPDWWMPRNRKRNHGTFCKFWSLYDSFCQLARMILTWEFLAALLFLARQPAPKPQMLSERREVWRGASSTYHLIMLPLRSNYDLIVIQFWSHDASTMIPLQYHPTKIPQWSAMLRLWSHYAPIMIPPWSNYDPLRSNMIPLFQIQVTGSHHYLAVSFSIRDWEACSEIISVPNKLCCPLQILY